MTDPFLAGHKVSRDVYTLAGRVPVSVRDQLVRAHYLVDRLFSSGKLSAGMQLVVVGAGAAGVNVAILAARRGARVLLLESGKTSFRLQRSCNTRWIDPVQYDWPAGHAEAGQWPISGPDAAVPLGFEAGASAKIATDWTSALNLQRLATPLNLNTIFGAKLVKVPRRAAGSTGPSLEVRYQIAGADHLAPCDVVVLARGIAGERTYLTFTAASGTATRFQGPLFWSDDGFEATDFGMSSPLTRPILVSGSGDGALQDYIRLTTGQKSAVSLLNMFRGTDSPNPVPGDIRRRLYEAEQDAQRSLSWNNAKREDHAVLQKLHQTYVTAIDEWQSQKLRWRNVVKALNVTVGTRDARNIRLYHQCTHFSACYSLNHLLALVVDRFISETTGQHTITGNVSVVSVEPPLVGGAHTHTCGPDCWRTTPHEVKAQTNVTCLSGPGTSSTVQVFDGVVVRHGLKQHTKADLRRHILPMHLT